jgi:hypothetical protein
VDTQTGEGATDGVDAAGIVVDEQNRLCHVTFRHTL